MQIYIENVLVDPRTGGFELLWKNLLQSVALIGRNTFCIKYVESIIIRQLCQIIPPICSMYKGYIDILLIRHLISHINHIFTVEQHYHIVSTSRTGVDESVHY